MTKSLSSQHEAPDHTVMSMSVPRGRAVQLQHREARAPIVYTSAENLCDDVLIQCAGWRFEVLDCPDALLDRPRIPVPSCLVLDVDWLATRDSDFHAALAYACPDVPVICEAAEQVDLALVVKVLKMGVFDVLQAPVSNDAMFGAIHRALEHSAAMQDQVCEVRRLRERYTSLSKRERQVMRLVIRGLLNKQVGAELGISEITVKAHRGRVMRKMQADSFARLVRMAASLTL